MDVDKVLVSFLLFLPFFILLLIQLPDFFRVKRNIKKIKNILEYIRPRYYFEMYGAEINPFTNRGLEKYIILEIKDKWVRYDDDGLTKSDKIEDLFEIMRRKVRLNKCEGWYLKDEHGNILLTL